jgi:putative component of toxin-antitoxin plasmid stabilization module
MVYTTKVKEIRVYRTASGAEPYPEWTDALRDGVGLSKMQARIARARLGNLGDHRSDEWRQSK